jgi:hypothetical protein
VGRKKVTWPIIKKRAYPTGSVAWVVDCGMVDGKRPRFTYDKKGEAETKAEQLRIEREKDGNAIFTLSAHDQTDAGRALSILAPINVSLSAAAEFYKTHAGLIQTKKTASQVADELLEAKAQDDLSARHRKNLRLQLKAGFAADERFASRPICEITTGELEAWLRELDVSPTTRNNYRTALGVFFHFPCAAVTF